MQRKATSLGDYRDWGQMPIYSSMIYLPIFLHFCESAEVLGLVIMYYRLSRTLKLAFKDLPTELQLMSLVANRQSSFLIDAYYDTM